MNDKQYKQDLLEVFEIAQKVKGKTLREIAGDNLDDIRYFDNKEKVKHFIQQAVFNIPLYSKMEYTFEDLDLELKPIALKYNKFNELTVKERLVLNDIYYDEIVNETFKTSKFINKNQLLLIMPYIYEYDKDFLDFKIYDAFIIDITRQKEFYLIVNDWLAIQEKVKKGKAEELNEGFTNILSACTKSQSRIDLKKQPYSNVLARFRSYSFNINFLKEIIFKKQKKIDYINEIFEENEISDIVEFKNDKIQDYLTSIIGTDISTYTQSKANQWHQIAFENFLKENNKDLFDFLKTANYKLIHKLTDYAHIQEQIPTNYELDAMEILHDEFEDSTFYQEIILKTYIVIMIDKNTNELLNYKLFRLSDEDIKKAQTVFYNAKKEIENLISQDSKEEVEPNFTKIKDNLSIHLRKSKKNTTTVYKLNDKEIEIPTYEFWINKNVIFNEK
ncbi:MutH/Sau3AI family endonuclease [Spiroplasma diminutum]|uniref:DNA mismatch repair protein MutH n=1 Tax=Spiroplasma diminutum CUAS-1 TaxID=1276221 RepID=S5MES1_9MOLU|nr:MutH/Sau3AI family endonuclease [Spiroplasma diminutum]AGR42258.1 DNA mismatch repair protein MutH [Spiroplasma diminutum CUAS-1]